LFPVAEIDLRGNELARSKSRQLTEWQQIHELENDGIVREEKAESASANLRGRFSGVRKRYPLL